MLAVRGVEGTDPRQWLVGSPQGLRAATQPLLPRIVCVTSPAPNGTTGPIQVAIKSRPPGISTQHFTYQVSAHPGWSPCRGQLEGGAERFRHLDEDFKLGLRVAGSVASCPVQKPRDPSGGWAAGNGGTERTLPRREVGSRSTKYRRQAGPSGAESCWDLLQAWGCRKAGFPSGTSLSPQCLLGPIWGPRSPEQEQWGAGAG